MFIFTYDFALFISAFVFGMSGTGLAYLLMKRLQVVDVPNERSNHVTPTPRGGGLGIVFAATCFLMVVDAPGVLIWGFIALAALSLCDDFRPLPARYRLVVHLAVVLWLLITTYEGRVFGDILPYAAELAILAVAWVWFINLFNFMDGSDGLASSEAACICIGLLALGVTVAMPHHAVAYALVILGSVLGFAMWNWQPAKVFMGDVGSIPLGFLLGFMLISLAGAGYWGAALILPAVFVADASLTLLGRMLKRERIFEAHSSHAYQCAIRGGMRHDTVARWVIGANVALIVLAIFSTNNLLPIWQLGYVAVAYALALALLALFASQRGKPQPAEPADPNVTEAEVVEEIPARDTTLPPGNHAQTQAG